MLINLLGPLLSSLNRNLDLLIYIRDLFFVRSFGVAHFCLSIHQNRDLLINILGPFLSSFIWGSPSLASTKSESRSVDLYLEPFLSTLIWCSPFLSYPKSEPRFVNQ
jgi:hypothetical protein